MTRALAVLMIAGAVASVGCAKKQTTESSGSLLSTSSSSSDEEEKEERDRGIRDDDVTEGGRGGQQGPGDKIPR